MKKIILLLGIILGSTSANLFFSHSANAKTINQERSQVDITFSGYEEISYGGSTQESRLLPASDIKEREVNTSNSGSLPRTNAKKSSHFTWGVLFWGI
ncbi:hypothetical protein ACOMX4_002538 [Enterococcus faecalis]